MMKTAACLFATAIALTGCATESAQDAGDDGGEMEEEGETVMPGPEVSVCDDGTDGLCGDPSCTADPNCEEATPGCTQNPLPPAPTDMTLGTGIFSARQVTTGNGKVYISAYATAATASGKIFTCSTESCASSPPSFGSIDPMESFVAPVEGKVVWSTRKSTVEPTSIMRANPDGSAPQTLLTTSIGSTASISGGAGLYDNYAVFTDVSDPGTSNAGVRAITSDLVSPPVPGISTPTYSRSALAAGDNYFAYYANPVSSAAAPYDRKIHIYDFDGNQVGVTAATTDWMRHMEITGDSLIYMTKDGFFSCSLPGCTSPKAHNVDLNTRGFTFTVKDGRVYFASVRDRGCNAGLDGVLASCSTETFLAGTCTPTVHSTSFHYVNMTSLSIEGSKAYFVSKTSTQVFKAAL